MRPPVHAVVRLHGRRVGELRYHQGGSQFRYEDQLSRPDHCVLGQIFEDDPQAVRRARVGVPPWFANLLPEGALRKQIVREMGGGNIGDFTLLLRVGSNLPGAVTVHADHEPVDDIAAEDSYFSGPDHPLRHSLAGIQLKYSVSNDRLTVPVSGDKSWWIVKLPDRDIPQLPLNEYLTMRWLAASGFSVPPVHVVSASAVAGIPDGMVDARELVYLIQRFDRSAAGPLHVEDFAQVADVEPMFKYGEFGGSYDGLAAVVLQLLGDHGYMDFIRRLVAMLITGNTDAHLKNWGLRYLDGRTAELSPVYDFHSLTIYSRYRYTPLALGLNGEKVPSAIDLDDFRRLGERVGADPEWTAELAVETVHRMRAAWDREVSGETRGRFAALADHFDTRLGTLPICQTVR